MYTTEKIYQLFRKHPNIITDSRSIVPGCLFFALKGERFNGNDYAVQAIQEGAAFAIVDEVVNLPIEKYIQVPDVLKTLQDLANHHRHQFKIPVLAITGSNGKTTTKELVSAVLSSHYPTHFTKGNLNNHIGVPLTLLAMTAKTEIAIIEMGANHPGEIDFLCRIAEPTHGLITNVGKAHLEGFGSFEGVKQTKSELYRYLAEHNGLVFINMDEPYLTELAIGNRLRLFYKKSNHPDSTTIPFEVKLVSELPFLEVGFLNENGEILHAKSQLIGQYNFNNLMTAVAIGKYFKVPGHKIKAAIENYHPSNNRSQLKHIGTNMFILDAYNANPTSMRTAIDSFSKMPAPRKVAILGAMKELGEYSQAEHLAVAEQAKGSGFEQVILVGGEFEEAATATGAILFENTPQLKAWFSAQAFNGTHFLVKGSRSIGLERLVEE
ncbi:MAG: UDP-N-acetylmuramoyl-tripeptide--D-alanyl-D-alanine ligase [Bacteroidetes bacterium]|nr:UDP-N-acetylmuramoyl-tripeptide--D-alanyl-D-alanine ligase [Bacteroidota bacterium]